MSLVDGFFSDLEKNTIDSDMQSRATISRWDQMLHFFSQIFPFFGVAVRIADQTTLPIEREHTTSGEMYTVFTNDCVYGC